MWCRGRRRLVLSGIAATLIAAAVFLALAPNARAESPQIVAERATPAALAPVEAIAAILHFFHTHDLVALGEGPHGNEQGHAFRLDLIRDPRFAATVNDIVVEFGSSRYQALMDRFVNGGDIPERELRRAWQDTTVTTAVWDRPIYEEFFRAVRAVNDGLPEGRRLRVLLGDPPIDWNRVRSHADVQRWGRQKSAHMTDMVMKEVVAKHRRALILWGDGGLQGRGVAEDRMLRVLDGPPPTKRMFIITSALWTMRSFVAMDTGVGSWPVPSLATIRGTALGRKPLATFFPLPPAPGWNTLRMEDAFDALLYLGAPESLAMSTLSPVLCADPAYVKMRLARLALSFAAVRQDFTDSFLRACSLSDAPK
jgi:hypothetical protein